MIDRRTLLTRVGLTTAAATLAMPAIVERARAQSAFDWKQAKGASIEVNCPKSPRADVLAAHRKEFEELTGIKVGFEQIPEQQQRPKVALEMASGHPSFDVLIVSTHVQKRLVEKAMWLEDLRPYVADASLTAPDYDMKDFSAAGMTAATAPDGRLNDIPINQDLFIVFWNKELFAAKGLTAAPTTFDEFTRVAKLLTDKDKGIYGFVGRGLKNANVALYDSMLLGWDQETISADGKTLLTDTPKAIAAAAWYQTLMRDCAPPGSVGFNWAESQTSFMQGRAAMWWDGIGFSAPLVDPKVSRVATKVGFAPAPRGPNGHFTATYVDAIGIPVASQNKKAAWLYVQWATNKAMMDEYLRSGAGTPPRSSPYSRPEIVKASAFPQEWFDTTAASLKIARSGLPTIVPVTEFRDTIGIGLTNIVGGADPATEMKKATATFQPILDRANAA